MLVYSQSPAQERSGHLSSQPQSHFMVRPTKSADRGLRSEVLIGENRNLGQARISCDELVDLVEWVDAMVRRRFSDDRGLARSGGSLGGHGDETGGDFAAKHNKREDQARRRAGDRKQDQSAIRRDYFMEPPTRAQPAAITGVASGLLAGHRVPLPCPLCSVPRRESGSAAWFPVPS